MDHNDREQVIAKATDEIQDSIADEECALRRQNVKLGAFFTPRVTGASLALVGGGPITPVGLTGAFVSVGSFLPGGQFVAIGAEQACAGGFLYERTSAF